MAASWLQTPQLLGGHPPPKRLQRTAPRRRQRAHVDLQRAERDEPAVVLRLTQQLLDPGSRGTPPQVRDAAGLSVGAIQQRVELVASPIAQLVGEQPLDVTVRIGARGGDHPRERVDRRAQHPAGTQVLDDEHDQRCRSVMLDGALNQPARQLHAVGVTQATPPEVGQRELQLVAACLRASAVGQQLMRGGVDLPGDERERLVGDRRDVLGHEP